MTEHEKHKIEYLTVFIGLAIFMTLFMKFRYDKTVLQILVGLVSLFYVAWGIIHHMLEGRLTKLIVVEYSLFGLFVFLLFTATLSF